MRIEKTKVILELRKNLVAELRRKSNTQHQPKHQIEVNDYDSDYDHGHDYHDK
jgi:hypothetical protein